MEGSMGTAKRYDARLVADVCGNKDVVMREAHDGLFVQHDDYAALEADLTAAEQRAKELQADNARLREINYELVTTHTTLVVENARQERAIWKFSGDPRAALAQPRTGSQQPEDKIADAMLDNLRASGKARESEPRTEGESNG
jgi:hypothetical protein